VKRALIITSFIMATVALAAFAQVQDVEDPSDLWEIVYSEDGDFTVRMPGIPSFERRVRSHSVGDVGESKYYYEHGGVDFTAEYSDLPTIAVLFGRRLLYRMAARHFLRECGGKELDSQKVRVGLYKGREISYWIPPGEGRPPRSGRAIFLLVDKRLYVLVAEGEPTDASSEAIERFLDSFELTYKTYRTGGHKYQELQADTLLPDEEPEAEEMPTLEEGALPEAEPDSDSKDLP